jgi:predicted thioesterase
MILEIGLKGSAELTVDDTNTAAAVHSGGLRVFGTPFMVALMEKAAYGSLQETLGTGETSVGTRVDIRHTAATPAGMRIRAESTVTAIDGRTVTFRVTACDEKGEIGSGRHERAIVDIERFTRRCYPKREEKNAGTSIDRHAISDMQRDGEENDG